MGRGRRLAALTAAVVGLAAPCASAHITDFAPLRAGAVAPGPGDTGAAGAALVDLKPPFEQMCGGLRTTGLDGVTG
jgi:hypothetical protein